MPSMPFQFMWVCACVVVCVQDEADFCSAGRAACMLLDIFWMIYFCQSLPWTLFVIVGERHMGMHKRRFIRWPNLAWQSVPNFHSCGLVLQLGKRISRWHTTCLSAGRDTIRYWMGYGDHDSFLLAVAVVWIFAVSVSMKPWLWWFPVYHENCST